MKREIGCLRTSFILFSIFLLYFPASALDNILTDEDMLLADFNIAKINKLDPVERMNYKRKALGIDSRVNKIVEEAYVCDDICPDLGSVYLRYQGVDREEECRNLGELKVSPGWHEYDGCSPRPVKINIYMKSGTNINNVSFVDKTDFFLRVGKYIKDEIVLGNRFSVYDTSSIFLNDINSIETINGEKLDKFQDAIEIPIALSNNQEQARVYFKAGVSLMASNAQEAVFLFGKTIELNPNFFEAYYKLSELYDKSGRRGAKEIIPLFEKLIGLSHEDANAYYVLGKAYSESAHYPETAKFNEKNMGKAIEMFVKALSLRPDFADVYKRMGDCYEEIKDYVKAIKSYEKWIELTKPQGAQAQYAYDALNSCKSSLANPFWVKGIRLRRNRKYDEAIAELRKALDIYPEYPEALYALGLTFKNKKDTQNATAIFEKLSHIEGKPWQGSYDARAFWQLGLIYKKLGDYTRARENFLKAIDIYKKWVNESKTYIYLSDNIAKIEKILKDLPNQN